MVVCVLFLFVSLQAYCRSTDFRSSDMSSEKVTSRLDRVMATICEVKQTGGVDCLTARGAEIWLVPTFKDVAEWYPMARREVGQDIEWRWDTLGDVTEMSASRRFGSICNAG